MRVILDEGACVAHGECVIVAPDIFSLGDDDPVATITQPEPGEELRPQLEAAIRACPADAIRIEE